MKNITPISENVKFLSRRIENEIDRINQNGHVAQSDSLVYIGNWQDAIPRSIWTDPTLSAMDVRCWGIIRTQAINGSAVMLSLNNLLKESLGYSKATISRVIYVLRLTRWISLCSTLRSETGQFKGNIYAIHDQPLPFSDAIYLDQHYLDFVKKQTTHRNPAIKQIAKSIWNVINDKNNYELHNLEQTSPTTHALHLLLKSKDNLIEQPNIKTCSDQVHLLNLREENNQVQILNLASKQDNPNNQSLNHQVQKMNLVPVCSSSYINNIYNKTTTTSPRSSSKNEPALDFAEETLIFPGAFNCNEQQLARMYLSGIDPELRQNFLDETAAQIKLHSKTNNPIRNPIGYLSWLCNQHNQGNTYLTSAYLNHQKQRKQQKLTEKNIKQQQNGMACAAFADERLDLKAPEDQRKTKQPSRNKKNQRDKIAQLKNAVQNRAAG